MEINSWDEVIELTGDISVRTGPYMNPINQALQDRTFSSAQETYFDEKSNFSVKFFEGTANAALHTCRDAIGKFCLTAQMREAYLSKPGRADMFLNNCVATLAVSDTACGNARILLQDPPDVPYNPELKQVFDTYIKGSTQNAIDSLDKIQNEFLPTLRGFLHKELGLSAEDLDQKIAEYKAIMNEDPRSNLFQGIENTAPLDPVKWHTLKNAPAIGPAPGITNE